VYLSRGYGRSTRGLRIVTEEDDARSVGDEAKWIFDNSNCIVVVGENRKHAIQNIKILFPEIDMIFMDDGLQHLSIIPSVKILLTDRNRLFIHDHLLPYGRLREHKKNAHDVDCIIVTKCEDDFNCDQKSLDELSAYRKPIFFSQYQYQSPRKMFHRERINSLPQRMILVTGIADVTYLLKYVGQSSIIKHFEFSDHHAFTRSEIVMIDTLQKETNAAVITTAKDEMRLMMFSSVITNLENWMVLDIDVMIHEPQKLLDIILDKIK
jgi:tetraacyldisaccharide 4'-kinase